ncbi:MAG: hypothetical protein R3274_11185 [Desulfobacterales bacterium]|nr:hypothetical protein [Desulfobacterales bacterium]
MLMDILHQKQAPQKRQAKVPKKKPRPQKHKPGVRLTPAQNRQRNTSPDNLCENRTTNFLLSKKFLLPPCGPATGGLLFTANPSTIPLFRLLPSESEPAGSFSDIFLPLTRRSGVPIETLEVNGGIKM